MSGSVFFFIPFIALWFYFWDSQSDIILLTFNTSIFNIVYFWFNILGWTQLDLSHHVVSIVQVAGWSPVRHFSRFLSDILLMLFWPLTTLLQYRLLSVIFLFCPILFLLFTDISYLPLFSISSTFGSIF